ncbi:MAG TPA: hypothetical protein VI911_00770 [Patescibacteria group bacterium]|nr:hypothetical protein [Patescibacteria group bacterium]
MLTTPIMQKTSLMTVDELKEIEKKNKKKLTKVFSKGPKEACPTATNKGTILDIRI